MNRYCLSLLLLILSITSYADVRLPAIIGDHMVLQQQATVKLWGWSEPGENIVITTNWDSKQYSTKGDANASWQLVIQTPKAGGPFTMNIKGNNSIDVKDIMIGEVWLCSGQSNMEMSIEWGLPYEKEASEATHKEIRFFYVPKTTAAFPQEDVMARWVVSNPEAMKKFSTVGYFFAKDLNDKLNVPVGMINASWGGTPAEVWTPATIVETDTLLKKASHLLTPSTKWPINPGATFNGMINPITKYAIAGALWYQGESNTGTYQTYYSLMTKMIDAWRDKWQQVFPFYLVQIAPYAGYGHHNISALLREQQNRIATHANTGIVVIHDLVDNIQDIHPKMKKEVGIRLADYALADHYKKGSSSYKYPQYKQMKIEGKRVRVEFSNTVNGLIVKGKELTDFYIAGADKVFKPAQARVEGNTVVVWNNDIQQPVAVRFGFNNTSMPNLYSKAGLPVSIFRTDDWYVDTSPVKK